MRDDDSGPPNNKAGYRSGTMLSFHTSPGLTYSMLMTIYSSGISEENLHYLLAFDIGIKSLGIISLGAMIRAAIGYPTHTSLVRMDGNFISILF